MTWPDGSTDPMRLRRFADIFRHESVAVSCHTHKYGREPAPLCDARSLADRSCRSDLSFRTGGVQIPRAPARISSGPSPKAAFSLGHPSLTAPGRTTHGVHHAIWFFIPFQYTITPAGRCQGAGKFLVLPFYIDIMMENFFDRRDGESPTMVPGKLKDVMIVP